MSDERRMVYLAYRDIEPEAPKGYELLSEARASHHVLREQVFPGRPPRYPDLHITHLRENVPVTAGRDRSNVGSVGLLVVCYSYEALTDERRAQILAGAIEVARGKGAI